MASHTEEINHQVQLDTNEMKDFLRHIMKNNAFIQDKGMNPIAVEVIGESGLGKTSVAIQMAKEFGINIEKVNLAQIEELGDLVGFPVRQFEMCKKDKVQDNQQQQKMVPTKVIGADGVAKIVMKPAGNTLATRTSETLWVDDVATEDYARQGYRFTGEKRMSYCPPEWIAGKTKGGILLLDDWNRAEPRFIQAVMELVDRQEYISWKLPPGWTILLTANPDDGEYMVNSIDVAQRTRFISSVLKWSHERWAEWAEIQGIDGRCINFVLFNPEIVNNRVNPRSLTTFFNSISSIKDFEESLPLIHQIAEGCIGPEAGVIFTTFIKEKLDRLISPKEILLKEDQKAVFEDMKEAVGSGNDYRSDIAMVLCSRLVNFAIAYADKNPIPPEVVQRVVNLIKEDGIFTDDLRYHIVKKINAGAKKKFEKILRDTEIQDIATK